MGQWKSTPLLLPTPLFAWEFTDTPLCTLFHSTEFADIAITYDHTAPLYTLTLTAADPMIPSPIFHMIFSGPAHPISTDRHEIAGNTLTVTDTGFGNVLRGLEVSIQAVASTDSQAFVFDLDDIAEPLAAFRACPAPATS